MGDFMGVLPLVVMCALGVSLIEAFSILPSHLAEWIKPVDDFDFLMKYNAEAEQFCTESMTYKGRQYGLTYYTDFMGFMCDEESLDNAGAAAKPMRHPVMA